MAALHGRFVVVHPRGAAVRGAKMAATPVLAATTGNMGRAHSSIKRTAAVHQIVGNFDGGEPYITIEFAFNQASIEGMWNSCKVV